MRFVYRNRAENARPQATDGVGDHIHRKPCRGRGKGAQLGCAPNRREADQQTHLGREICGGLDRCNVVEHRSLLGSRLYCNKTSCKILNTVFGSTDTECSNVHYRRMSGRSPGKARREMEEWIAAPRACVARCMGR